MDQLNQTQRSELMKKVRQKDTRPELQVRKFLHGKGLRYVIANRQLPGTPDLTFPRYKVVVFIHGCFWHGHDCRKGRPPSTNCSYWLSKIESNRERDARKEKALCDLGWRVFTIWECQLNKKQISTCVLEDLAKLIRSAQ